MDDLWHGLECSDWQRSHEGPWEEEPHIPTTSPPRGQRAGQAKWSMGAEHCTFSLLPPDPHGFGVLSGWGNKQRVSEWPKISQLVSWTAHPYGYEMKMAYELKVILRHLMGPRWYFIAIKQTEKSKSSASSNKQLNGITVFQIARLGSLTWKFIYYVLSHVCLLGEPQISSEKLKIKNHPRFTEEERSHRPSPQAGGHRSQGVALGRVTSSTPGFLLAGANLISWASPVCLLLKTI